MPQGCGASRRSGENQGSQRPPANCTAAQLHGARQQSCNSCSSERGKTGSCMFRVKRLPRCRGSTSPGSQQACGSRRHRWSCTCGGDRTYATKSSHAGLGAWHAAGVRPLRQRRKPAADAGVGSQEVWACKFKSQRPSKHGRALVASLAGLGEALEGAVSDGVAGPALWADGAGALLGDG